MSLFSMIRMVMVMIPMFVRMVMGFLIFVMAVGMLVIMGVDMVMRMVVFILSMGVGMFVIMAVVVVMIVFVFIEFNFHFDSPYKIVKAKKTAFLYYNGILYNFNV